MSVNNGYIELYGGQDEDNGVFQLYGRDSSSFAGSFRILARNKNSTICLYGTPGGELTWNDKSIVYIEQATDNCIRYNNGLQICWGIFESNDSTVTDVNFDLPFKDYNICTSVTEVGMNGADPYAGGFRVTGIFQNYMSIQNLTNGTNRCDWTARGYWK